MKNLLYSLCVGLCLCGSLAYGAGESINVNFPGGSEGNNNKAGSRLSDNASYKDLNHGAHSVVGTLWNDVPCNTTLATPVKALLSTGTLETTGTVTIALSHIANPYEVGNNGVKDRLLYGYLDDSGGPTVDFTKIPFSNYTVYLYFSTDSDAKKFSYATINDTNYCGSTSDGTTVGTTQVGTTAWGKSKSGDTFYALGESVNYLKVDNLTLSALTIKTRNDSGARGGIAGIQIVNTGTFLTKTWTAAPIGAGPHQLSTILAADGHQGEAGAADTFTNLTITLDPGATLNIDTNATLGLLKIVSENLNGAAVTITQGVSGSIANIGKVDCSAITGTFTTPDLPGYPQSVTFTVPTIAAWNGVTKPTTAERATPTATTAYGLNATYAQTINGKASVVVNFTGATGKPEIFGGVPDKGGAITKDIWLKVLGGSYNIIHGGSNGISWQNSTAANIDGNILVDMAGGTADYVFGGNGNGKPGATLKGNLAVVIRDQANVTGTIAGGGYNGHDGTTTYGATDNKATLSVTVKKVLGAATATAINGLKQGYIVGGGMWKSNQEAHHIVNGSTAIIIDVMGETGTQRFERTLIGGGAVLGSGTHPNGTNSTVSDKASVSVTAPNAVTFTQKIVGGGYAEGTSSVTTGSSEVTLNGGTYTNEIIGGGVGTNSASGAATVTLASGNFSAATVKPGVATTSALNITGDVTINTLEPFTTYTIAAGKTLTVNTADLSASEAPVTLKKGATGTLTLGTKRAVTFAGFDGGIVSVTTDTTVTTATFPVTTGVTAESLVGTEFLLNGLLATATIANSTLTLTPYVPVSPFSATMAGDQTFSTLVWTDSNASGGKTIPFATLKSLATGTATLTVTANSTLTVDDVLTIPVTLTTESAVTLTANFGERRPTALIACGANVTLKFNEIPLIDSGTITLTYSGTPTIEIYRKDGTTPITPVTNTAVGDVHTLTFEPQLDGNVATWDYEFNGNRNSVGSDTTALTNEGTDITAGETTLQVGKCTPHRAASYSSTFTAVFATTVPSMPKVILLAFGASNTAGKSAIALVSGETAGEVMLVKSLNGAAYQTLATMTVPNATTQRHLYAFVQKSAREFDIYLDGELWTTYHSDADIVLGGGFQIGSIYGGVLSTGLVKAADAAGKRATMDVLRLYNGTMLSVANMRALAKAFPYESPAGMYTRTVDATASQTWNQAATWTKTGEAAAVAEPVAGAAVVLNSTAAASVAVNRATDVAYESLTFTGNAITLTRGNGAGKIVNSGKTQINTDVTLEDSAVDISGGPLFVASGKTLTLDLSRFDYGTVSGTITRQLTGRTDATVTVNLPPTKPASVTVSVEKDPSTSCYMLHITNQTVWTATATEADNKWSTVAQWTGVTGAAPTSGTVRVNFAGINNATLTIDTVAVSLDTLVVENMGTTNSIILGQNVTVKVLEMVSASGKTLTVNCGTFAFTVANGSSPTTIGLNGGTLRKLGAGSLTLDHTTVTQGAMAFIGGATTCTAATFGVSGNEGKKVAMTLNGGTLTGTLTLANATDVTVSAATSEIACNITNNGGFTKKGPGTLTYSGVMSGNGKLDVAAGKLILTAVNTRPAEEHTALATTLVSSGATLEILSNATLNDKGRYHNSPVTVEGTLTISDFTHGGGALGALTNNNDKFILRGGTLNIQETTSTERGIKIEGSTASTIQMAEGKTLTIPTTDKDFKVDAPLTLTGAGNVIIAHTITGTGALTLAGSGTVAFNSTAAVPNAITVNKGATIKGTANLSGAVTFNDGAKIDASANELRLTNANAPTISGTVAVIPNAGAVKGSYIVKCSGTPDVATAEKLMVPGWSVTAVTTAGSTGYTLGLGVGDLPKPKEGDSTVYTPEAARELAVMATKAGATSVTSVTAKTATGNAAGGTPLSAAEASAALGCFSNIANANVTGNAATITITYDFGISALAPTADGNGLSVTAAVQGASGGTPATFAAGVVAQLYADNGATPVATTAPANGTESALLFTLDATQKAAVLNKVLTVKATKPDPVTP